ncbi:MULTISPECIES: type II toxin-antitoxin system VapC family toxin [unclassified Schlesneria]|uniref:type II toxin-antitoxin system VapC family toxin n=1 Tax=unclassified Schlesneria TaxID=2762017 RepID=UPI002EFCA385
MTHIRDTNAFVDHLRRGPNSKVTASLLAAPPGSVYLCSVVLAELIFGAIRSGPAHEASNRAMVARLQAQFLPLPFDDLAAEEYGKLRAYLTSAGRLIGPNDLMIAAVALANRMTLVTHNLSEFRQVPGLLLEDWQ